MIFVFFFFSSRRRHTRSDRDWSSDVCSSDLAPLVTAVLLRPDHADEPGLAELAREPAVEAAPGERALGRASVAQLALEEIADLRAGLLRLGRQLTQLEVERGHSVPSYDFSKPTCRNTAA